METKIFLISGKSRHGKDSTANVISAMCQEYNLKHLNLQYSTYLKEYAKNISNWDGSEEKKPRELLQQLGTEIIRKQIDSLFFIKRMIEDIKIYSRYFDVITISDVRYRLEIEIPKGEFANIYAINVIRPNYTSELTGVQKQHLTEIDLDNYNNYDYKIINDGTLEDLDKKVRRIIKLKEDNKKSHELMRQLWLDFWKEKGHEVVSSASLIPLNDPTLLWTNSGVAALKKYFDGTIVPKNPRLTNSQKCIRTNDIEVVGKTARHATFFEMLGNFSVGNYFKEEAINWAWEFLTNKKWLGFAPEKLYITIYPTDDEAFKYWKNVGVAEEHIIRLEGNFWEIGSGPCGPCSEIFYDRGEEYDPNKLGLKLLIDDLENDRYIEIWNNVFSMYNAKEGVNRENYEELPSKNIDTGMGLERMLVILQDVETIFETDLFLPIIKELENISKKTYNGDLSFKVIADHIRTITLALGDGANFGNGGRDYVLRRLIRRIIMHGKRLNIEGSFVALLVPIVIEIMKNAYPYLMTNQEMIMEKVTKEEQLFQKTLVTGEKKLLEIINDSIDKKIDGLEAFKLYDTYGFPIELTMEMASEKGFEVDLEGFKESMKWQQEQARTSRINIESMSSQNESLINYIEKSEFIGYDTTNIITKIIGLFNGEIMVDELINSGYVVLEKTPFYVESGGQVSDKGQLIINNQLIEVGKLFKGPNGQHFHFIEFEGTLKLNDEIKAEIDENYRMKITQNHSATHLLQRALQEVLGVNVKQAGSRVDDKTLRFDFVYDKKIDDEQLLKVEDFVNQQINNNNQTIIEIIDKDKADGKGALAFFEDKYDDKVRVVTMGDSVELCGGTHVKNTSDIESFVLISLENKGDKVYRILATTGDNIETELFKAIKPYNDGMINLLQKGKRVINNAVNEGFELPFDIKINHEKPLSYKDVIFNRNELEYVKEKVQTLEKNYLDEKKKRALTDLSVFENNEEVINNINTIIMSVNNYELVILKEIVNVLSNRRENSFIFLANINNDNVNYIAKASSNLQDKINCGQIVKEASIASEGSGGGGATFGQGGGTSIVNVTNIIKKVKDIIKN